MIENLYENLDNSIEKNEEGFICLANKKIPFIINLLTMNVTFEEK